MQKITVVIPCYNEEDGIAEVIKGFPIKKLEQHGYTLEVLVIDNNSSDNTTKVAKEAGATVIHEAKQGKGNAIRTGFYNISPDTDYVVMLDGDNTYHPSEILRLVEPLASGFSDVIIGSRMGGKIKAGSMKAFNRLGNWTFSFMVRMGYQVNVTDVLTGYFAWKREAIVQLRPHLKSQGFAIEMEMITKMAKLGLSIYSVPISYDPRLGDSSLHPLRDGSRILKAFFEQMLWRPKIERIAFVSDAVYPFNKGGKEKRLYEIARRLVKEGREVHIYTMKWWDGPKDIVHTGIHMHAICRLYPLYYGDRRSIKQALLFSLACVKLLTKKFDIVDVDHMPVFPLVTMRVVCWLKFKKMYATWHEVWGREYWNTYLGKKGALGWLAEWFSFKLPDVIISNSQHTTNNLMKAGIKKEIKTIPLGVDISSIFSSTTHELKSDIIYVGRLLKHKNVHMLIESIGQLREQGVEVSCVIIGDGPERERLEGIIDEMNLKNAITFFHFIESHEELYGLMKASKILILPSEREGFGLVALEANACGIPVLTLNHPSNATTSLIVSGENGDTFTDVNSLSILIAQYLKTPLVHEVAEFAEKYDWSKTTALIERSYSS